MCIRDRYMGAQGYTIVFQRAKEFNTCCDSRRARAIFFVYKTAINKVQKKVKKDLDQQEIKTYLCRRQNSSEVLKVLRRERARRINNPADFLKHTNRYNLGIGIKKTSKKKLQNFGRIKTLSNFAAPQQ
eukprot:TRINITY_DN6892_c0_g1_i1.p2 TRINITY_DN6892_c0_g1~~TRINITY_DN6892_c0_g1_i1.p2  ORF type:complete len:129 (-),score=8.80 TRINITY_DN6892_c0_g1_i1:78-464(-)